MQYALRVYRDELGTVLAPTEVRGSVLVVQNDTARDTIECMYTTNAGELLKQYTLFNVTFDSPTACSDQAPITDGSWRWVQKWLSGQTTKANSCAQTDVRTARSFPRRSPLSPPTRRERSGSLRTRPCSECYPRESSIDTRAPCVGAYIN